MVVCSLCGFMVAAQFVSVNLVEISYYVATAGVGVLKLASTPMWESTPNAATLHWQTWSRPANGPMRSTGKPAA
jgi:hypothetical protein